MKLETQTLTASDGCEIFVRAWRAATPAATVVIAHGHGEHGGRYEHVAERLTREGWDVIVPDHRGHGLSGGPRGHVLRWDHYSDDLQLAIEKAANAKLPMALIGHSMGGLIAINYALRKPERLKALLLSSPLLKLAFPVPPLKKFLGNMLSNLIPALALPTGLDSKHVSRDPAVVAAYEKDPLVHDKASTRWFTEMVAMLEASGARAGELKMPLLLFHAGGDKLTDPEGSRVFFKHVTMTERQFKEWPGLYHEIFNEPEKGQVLDELVTWLKVFLK